MRGLFVWLQFCQPPRILLFVAGKYFIHGIAHKSGDYLGDGWLFGLWGLGGFGGVFFGHKVVFSVFTASVNFPNAARQSSFNRSNSARFMV